MKKQRLIELQNKANENAELKDVIEIISEFFLSQSQHNKEISNILTELGSKINKIQMKVNEIAKYTTTEPLAQIMIENFEEFEKEKYAEEDEE
jgi:DNA integrity scanning protein DisA with diadenylate cyclase activity